MTTTNEYLKTIYEDETGTTVETPHTNNYYLHGIAVSNGCSYTKTECNGRYLKDIAEAICETTFTGVHFNNYYYHRIAEKVSSQTYDNNYDNFFLNIWANSSVTKDNSSLVWIVPPSNMEYGDFNASGVLSKQNSSEKISGATVHLVIGSTVVDSAVTDSNGVVTFENSPVHVGTHSFKLVFNGNRHYNNTESSVVTITVSKETTYLNVEEYDPTAYSDGTAYIFGQLLDNDSVQHSVVGETVQVIDKSDNTVLDTTVTDEQGYFDFDLSLSAGTYSLRVDYAGTDDYIGSYSDISVSVVDPYIEIVVDKPVLSYADGDAAAIGAVVHSGLSRLDNIRVDFKVEDAAFVTYGVTDTDGVCTAPDPYQSAGIGDVVLEAEATVGGTFVSKTYSITDAIKYTSDGTGLSGTYNTGSDGTYDYITRLQSILDPNTALTSSCEISYKFKVTNTSGTGNGSLLWCIGSDVNNGVLIGTEGNSNRMRIYSRSNGNNTPQQTSNNVYSLNTWFDVKITYNNGTISITVGGQTVSYSLASVAYFKTYTSASYDVQLSQFIVKPL